MIDATFFTNNRMRLLESVKKDVVVVLTAYEGMQLTGDMSVPFRQEANFWYLTGVEDPNWRVIYTRDKSWLVSPALSDIQQIFEGGLSADEAKKVSGVDEVIDTASATVLLRQLTESGKEIATLGRDPYAAHYGFTQNPAQQKLFRYLEKKFASVYDVRSDLTRQRAVKQPQEIAAIKEAVQLTTEAFAAARQEIGNLQHEYELEARFTYEFRRHNAQHAYDPIVASGGNACTLHYTKNSDLLRSGELVLVDIGAKKGGYAADITRTYAVGEAADRQTAVHHALAAAHEAIIDLLRPGATVREYQDQSDAIMKNALATLGLLNSEDDYRRYFPHAISHGLGVDVHDSLGGYKEWMPGMVLTVEPGIYIPEEKIGVRLEDNILITESGCENLSQSLSLDL